MKLVNTNDINKMIEDNGDPGHFYDGDQEDHRYPCYQVSFDAQREEVLFLIDNKELFSYSSKGIDLKRFRTATAFRPLIQLLKEGDIKGIKKAMKEYEV